MANLYVIEGGLPPEQEWTEAEIRRLCMPTIKALPFVKLKQNAESQWHPESFWNVCQTRSRNQDLARGAQYALAAMTAMRADGRNVLSHIFRDMIDARVERTLKAQKVKSRNPGRDLVMSGFLDQLVKMFEPRDGGEFVAEMDRVIEDAGFFLRRMGDDDCSCSKEVREQLRYHIKQLQKLRERLSFKPDMMQATGDGAVQS